MMSKSKAIAMSVYLGAVLIGAAAGIAVDRNVWPSRLGASPPNPRSMRERLYADLQFTAAQRASADSLFDARRRADSVLTAPLDSQVRLLRPQRDSIRAATDARLRALLSPEQVKLWDDLQARQQEMRRQRPNDGRR
jgi:Spy/CpxP family protein refolding chaperone